MIEVDPKLFGEDAWLVQIETDSRIFSGERWNILMNTMEVLHSEETKSVVEGSLTHFNPQTGEVYWGPCPLTPLQCEKLVLLQEDQAINKGSANLKGISVIAVSEAQAIEDTALVAKMDEAAILDSKIVLEVGEIQKDLVV